MQVELADPPLIGVGGGEAREERVEVCEGEREAERRVQDAELACISDGWSPSVSSTVFAVRYTVFAVRYTVFERTVKTTRELYKVGSTDAIQVMTGELDRGDRIADQIYLEPVKCTK